MAGLTSCSLPVYVRSASACPPPPPPPPCAPAAFTQQTLDTTTRADNTHWRITRVLGARSALNEFGILPVGSGEGLLVAGRDKAVADYQDVRFVSVAAIESAATTAKRTSMVPYTAVMPGHLASDASIVVGASPLPSPVNLPVWWDGHPSVYGKFMVFASDRPGGMGGTDVWYTVGDNPTTVRSLGSIANTPCDEISPWFVPDGSAILFSSTGHASVGGYDIFRAPIRVVADSIIVLAIENLGMPVNTPSDEVFPTQVGRETLYYGSDQPLPGEESRSHFDVFVLHKGIPPVRETAPRIVETTPAPLPVIPEERASISGVVINEKTQQPVPDAEVTARLPESKAVISSTRTDESGRYVIDVPVGRPVDVQAQSSDLFFDGFRVEVPAEKAKDTIVRESPLALPVTYVLRVNFPTSVFDAPYDNTLDSNGIETTTRWNEALDELASSVASNLSKLKRLVLIGHTDDVDTDANNMKLGKNRVDFIMNELAKRGIPQNMMEGRSAGERLLPARRPNEPQDQWRKRSRRVELVKVVSQ